MGDLGRFFDDIKSLRSHAATAAAEDDFVVVEDASTWSGLFDEHFFRAEDGDDMLFYVKQGSTDLHVVRKTAKTEPETGSNINWEESVYLNLFLQKFKYTLTMVVCVRNETHTKVLQRIDHVVFCSPSRRTMEDKGAAEVPTFPDLYFPIDTFDNLYAAIEVPPDAMLRVELVAAAGPVCASVFSGQVPHSALAAAYARANTGLARASPAQEFLKLTGPNNVGRAQIAVGYLSSPTATGIRGLFSSLSRALGPSSDTPLHACMTYASLSLSQLVAAVFESPRSPILKAAIVRTPSRAASVPPSPALTKSPTRTLAPATISSPLAASAPAPIAASFSSSEGPPSSARQ
eukprot:m.10908 g.10908  ORF g.10908 m.10908 type:complete len:347 (+) comp5693_c0_seq2:131-1171(+)